jgi:hypothetical protein
MNGVELFHVQAGWQRFPVPKFCGFVGASLSETGTQSVDIVFLVSQPFEEFLVGKVEFS